MKKLWRGVREICGVWLVWEKQIDLLFGAASPLMSGRTVRVEGCVVYLIEWCGEHDLTYLNRFLIHNRRGM